MSPLAWVVRSLLVLLALACSATVAHSQPPEANPHTGPFGRPFGTVVTVEGVAVDGTSTRMKEHEGQLLLRVEKVDGNTLPTPLTMTAHTLDFAPVVLPRGGEHFQLVGYADGRFVGIPSAAFKYVPRVATQDFAFHSELCVLKNLLNR